MNEKAIAYVYGSAEYPRLQGIITFHQIQDTKVMLVQEMKMTLLQMQEVITILQTALTHITPETCHHFFQTMDMPLCQF